MLSSSTKACFNSNCKQVSDKWRTGWRRRTGEYAHLCDRCAAVYEDGKYCETFHMSAPGWRCCESCGKQIHCGCIVSFHMFVLLDKGGIECLSCARKSYILTPNPAWPPPLHFLPSQPERMKDPPLHFLPSQPERMKDLSVKPWSSIAGSGPVPWRQAPSLFNGSVSQSNMPPRMLFEMNVSGCVRDRLSTTSPQMKTEHSYEQFVNGDLSLGPSEAFHQNGNTGFHVKERPYYPFVNDIKPLFPKIDSSHSNLNLSMSSSSNIEADDAHRASMISEPESMSIFMGKQHCCHNGMSSRNGPQICSGKPRGDGRGRKQLLPRYHTQISEEMFRLIPRDSKSVITPLFEKMLSVSDAGRIGRLVVPKKCAESYFPPISQPEGLPLKVQDVKGKEWVFQFRFWPNNNSRIYVLEGITPCIQSMHLQAGDVVTFSRVDPEGKLVMGCRKASVVLSSDQVDRVNYSLEGGSDASYFRDVTAANKPGDAITNTILGSDASNLQDVTAINKPGDVITSTIVGSDALNPWDVSPTNKLVDVITVNDHTKVAEITPKDKPTIQSKRKISSLGARNKRLRIVNDDAIQLNLTWREAQGLMRPPEKIVPSIFVVEGCEFEEFEGAAPVIGRPTIPGTDHFIAKIQWVQCEDCFKWRKVPADVLLSSRWTCSENVWDLDRSRCSSAEQLTKEQLEHILPTTKIASSSKTPEITEEVDEDLFVALEGLDKLANLAIKEENENEEGPPASSSDNTSKHLRHKSGCMCIVCLQPPSGKGSKHNQSCECVVCISSKRRLRTLTDRREKKQSERETETSEAPTQLSFQVQGLDEPNTSPKKGQIDLNIQPEREEDQLSPGSGAGGPMSFAQRCFRRMLGR